MASEKLQNINFDTAKPNSKNLEFATAEELRAAIAEIKSLCRRSDGCTTALATEVARLKTRLIRDRAAIAVTWSVWIAREAKLSRSYVYVLAKIGSSPDPHSALKEAQSQWQLKKRDKKGDDGGRNNFIDDGLSENHRMILELVPKLTAREAKTAYVALWQQYRNRIG